VARKNKDNRAVAAQQAQIGIVQSKTTSQSFSGPLPPPQVLAEYNQTVPGAAERLISMAEDQSKHRIEMESKALDAEIKRANVGLWLGAGICLAFLAVSGVLIFSGHDIAGASLGGASLASIAGIFVIGTSAQRAERKDRMAMLTGNPRR
jgi:uncharacterized membrane protein